MRPVNPGDRMPGGDQFGPRIIEMGHQHRGGPGGLLALMVLGLLIAAVVYLWVKVSRLTRPATAAAPMVATPVVASAASTADAAINLLRTRYASGEVARDDYLRMAADLGAPVNVPTAPPAEPPVAPPG